MFTALPSMCKFCWGCYLHGKKITPIGIDVNSWSNHSHFKISYFFFQTTCTSNLPQLTSDAEVHLWNIQNRLGSGYKLKAKQLEADSSMSLLFSWMSKSYMSLFCILRSRQYISFCVKTWITDTLLEPLTPRFCHQSMDFICSKSCIFFFKTRKELHSVHSDVWKIHQDLTKVQNTHCSRLIC
jgi:hypothetical protein